MADVLTLRTYPEAWIIIRCDQCGREGRYRRETLIARYGADAALPDVLGYIVAACDSPRYTQQPHCARPRFIDPATGKPWSQRQR